MSFRFTVRDIISALLKYDMNDIVYLEINEDYEEDDDGIAIANSVEYREHVGIIITNKM